MKLKYLTSFILISIFASVISANLIAPNIAHANDGSSVFFTPGISVESLVSKYAKAPQNGKIKILIVPGHEPNSGGTNYKNIYERNLTLQLGAELKNYLSQNPRYEVVMSRDANGWNPDLEKYVTDNASSILSWEQIKHEQMTQLIDAGKVTLTNPTVYHDNATSYAALYLYGINKWAGENNFDIAIHIHFNDNPKYKGKPTYHGFAIYAPEYQYSNSSSSMALAADLFNEIFNIQYVSTMPGENVGIVPEQNLIAIGEFNTSNTLAVLIEYAYIYEHVMLTKTSRDKYIDKAARVTAQGVNDFFNSRLASLKQ